MPTRTVTTLTWAGLVALILTLLYGALSSRPDSVSAQTPAGVSRPWVCWASSIAEQSILPQVMPDGCVSEPRPSSITLGPRASTRAIRAAVAPNAPTGLAGSVSGNTVTLTWNAPAGGDPPTSYVLEAGSASGLRDLANSDTFSTVPALTATNVPPGTYYVRVRARIVSTDSAPSNEIVVTVTGSCPTLPGPPSTLLATVSGSAVTLTWNAPAGCAPSSYHIEAGSASGLSNLASFSTGSAATSYSANGVGAGTYYVRVRSVNAAGMSAPSNELQFMVGGCSAAPSAPAGLVAQVSGNSVILSWTASAGSPASYILEAGSVSGSADIVSSDTGNLATTLSATAGPGTYYVRVRARNACGTSAPSNEIIVVVNSGSSCVALSPTSQAVQESATVGSVTVTAPPSCAWTAVSNASFITVTSGSSGVGSGSVSYSVSANTTGSSRSGTLTIGGQTFTLTQQVCSFIVFPTLLGEQGGSATINVTAPSSCSWTVQSNASFITVTSASSGIGSAPITINAQANSNILRGGTLTVGQPMQMTSATIVQTGPTGSANCVTAMTTNKSSFSGAEPTSFTFPAAGNSRAINVYAPNSCAWIGTATVSWIDMSQSPPAFPPFGLGNSHFDIVVPANPTDQSRSGAVVAGGQAFQVSQLGCGGHSVSPTSLNVLVNGGTAAITVTTQCPAVPWTATSNASFLTITSGANGTGNGSVSVAIAPNNTGSARSGTATIAGQTVTFTQAGS